MSPRRALATAVIVAVLPACLFLGGVTKHSEKVCSKFPENMDLKVEDKKDFNIKCQEIVKSKQLNAFYWLLITSIFVNWPVIRWLDDRQWYREWKREEP